MNAMCCLYRGAALALLVPVLICAATSDLGPTIFEELASGPDGAWRSWTGGGAVEVRRDRFSLSVGGRLRLFRWSPGMGLARLDPQAVMPSRSYRLDPAGPPRVMRHSKAVRAASANGDVAVRYYHGARGFEFDIETASGAPLPELTLEVDDGVFEIGEGGKLLLDGLAFMLRPVAYIVVAAGERRPVDVTYRLEHSRCLVFQVAGNRPAGMLVIDPVITYATYFGGADRDRGLAVRELSDGAVLLAGNSRSPDLPNGFVLSGLSQKPIGNDSDCFVAKLYPAKRQIAFVSYLGAYGSCVAMDLDSKGRILLAGYGSNTQFTTPDAQYRAPAQVGSSGVFLARISVLGDKLEYCTYLRSDFDLQTLRLKAGQEDRVYLASLAGIHGGETVVRRYDIGKRQFDGEANLAKLEFAGMELDASGAVFVYGSTRGQDLPLVNAVQKEPPSAIATAGFVAAFSGDLKVLLFSTYLGGQGGRTHVRSLLFGPTGALILSGGADQNSIPGLDPALPNSVWTDRSSNVFNVEVRPGQSAIEKGFLSGGHDLTSFAGSGFFASFFGADGRVCLLADGRLSSAFPGANVPRNSGIVASLVGCLNESGSDFDFLAPTRISQAPIAVARSAAGGLWILSNGGHGSHEDAIGYDLWSAAIQPTPSLVFDDLFLAHLDLAVVKPRLVEPTPLRLWVSAFAVEVPLSGTGFASTMYLDLGTQRLLVNATTSTAATLRQAGYSDTFIPPGAYEGRLVVPSSPELTSDPFPVVVDALPPAVSPTGLIPAGARVLRFGGDDVQIDRARRILYTLNAAANNQWTLTAVDLSGGQELRSASFSRRGATRILGLELSRDGRFLYFADDLNRIQRFRTDSLEKDLEFPVDPDAPPVWRGVNLSLQIRAFEDEPESLLIATPAGRLIIYDRDRPRPYGSVDFPPRMAARMRPILATANFIYAVDPSVPAVNPCLIRYPVDAFGLQPPEEFCEPAVQWGRYPEMKRFPGALVLEAGETAVSLRWAPHIFNGMVTPHLYDTARDLAILQATGTIPDPMDSIRRLAFARLGTGEVIGFFPAQRTLTGVVSAFFLDDNTMVVVTWAGASKLVTIEQNWQADFTFR